MAAIEGQVDKQLFFHVAFYDGANEKRSGLVLGVDVTLRTYHDDEEDLAFEVDAFSEIGATGEYAVAVTFASRGAWQLEFEDAVTGEQTSEYFTVQRIGDEELYDRVVGGFHVVFK